MPVVLRSTFNAALAKAADLEAELRREIEALREALAQLADDRDAMATDRDRVADALARALADRDRFAAAAAQKGDELAAAQAAFEAYHEDASRDAEATARTAAEALGAAHAATTEADARTAAAEERIAAAAAERDQTQQALADAQAELVRTIRRLDDLRAETERLGGQVMQLQAMHRGDVEAIARGSAERERISRRLEDFEAEADRLGKQVLGVIAENRELDQRNQMLESENTLLRVDRSLLLSRSPLLVGTFPRSGTWMLKYFLHYLDHFCRIDEAPAVRDIYQAVTGDPRFLLAFARPDLRPQHIEVSHWMCPGVFSLPDTKIRHFLDLLDDLGCSAYQRANNSAHEMFAPAADRGKIVFVYRNPLDVYRSYADLFERRSGLADRQQYPFNPMVPWGTDLMNAEVADPFNYFVSQFSESGFSKFFAAYCLSFLLVRESYPDHVFVVRYEDAMRDRRSYLEALVSFGKVGDLSTTGFSKAFDRAFEATTIEAMRRYEHNLGHAISGERTFYGESSATHLSTKKRNWRDLFTADQISHLCDTLQAYDRRLLDLVPELSA